MDLHSSWQSDECLTSIYVEKEECPLSETLWSELPKGLRLLSCWPLVPGSIPGSNMGIFPCRERFPR